MTVLEQIKERIEEAGPEGIPTAHIRDDYDPIGDSLMMQLLDHGDYVQRKIQLHHVKWEWRIYKRGYEPY